MTETDDRPLVFEVGAKGGFTSRPVQPPDAPAFQPTVVRARSSAAAKQDEMRRPQAAVLYRALRDAGALGLSWKECWALSTDEEFTVGPIVIWMRFHGCDVEARYDAVAGETRFYLIV